jgi:hypothetical protein
MRLFSLVAFAFCASGTCDAAAQEPAGHTLGIDGDRFTIDGQPTFLLGLSYYGGLGATEESIARDLDDAQRHGINWIRVWANWGAFDADVSAVDRQGQAREPFLARLQGLVAECDRRGLVVDVTLSRGPALGGGGVASAEAHRRAVETLIGSLAGHRNWYLDLANERNIADERFVGIDELAELRAVARRFDPRLLVTASSGGDISQDELRDLLLVVEVDFLCPHRPRDAASPADTEELSRRYRQWMETVGRVVPLHYQEPFRRDYGDWQPAAEDFLADLRGAVAGGAAGWCLHNGDRRTAADGQPRRSFDLRERRLLEQLDDEEQAALRGLRDALGRDAPGS